MAVANLDRRHFLAASAAGVATLALDRAFWRHALAAPVSPGSGPYGPLSPTPDANGLHLPAGFASRVVARSMTPVLGHDSYVWHMFPDGGATYPTSDGGWIYVSNCEVPAPGGGAGALRFGPDATIIGAYSILSGTGSNCAGGPTPWGTWLSCEEADDGHVWECDPTGRAPGVELPLMGTFAHEAAAVDPVGKAIYLTEDEGDSRLYRFLPFLWPTGGRPDLSGGRLQAAVVDPSGRVTWRDVSPDHPDRSPETTSFRRGEGAWHEAGIVYFTTTGDNRVWALDCKRQRLSVLYDGNDVPGAPLTNVDNVTVHRPSGDLFVAEDPGNVELCLIASDKKGNRQVAPFVRVAGSADSEVTGPAFSPAGDRLYFSSQRGGGVGTLPGPGIAFEVTGPFRRATW